MAAPQWTGGKCKSVQHAKAFFRHNTKEERAHGNHSNMQIDKSKTHLNYSYRGLTYQQRGEALDQRLAAIDTGRQSSGANARVLMQSVIVYPPAGIRAEVDENGVITRTRDQVLKAWFMRAGDIIKDQFGDENFIDMSVDVDEVHEYTDKETGEKRLSLEHGHAWLVPEVDGKLNGKQFSAVKNINALNNSLQAMSLKEFGCPMMDGTGKKGGLAVEELKARDIALTIIREAREEADQLLGTIRRQAEAMEKESRGAGLAQSLAETCGKMLERAEQRAEEARADAQRRADEEAQPQARGSAQKADSGAATRPADKGKGEQSDAAQEAARAAQRGNAAQAAFADVVAAAGVEGKLDFFGELRRKEAQRVAAMSAEEREAYERDRAQEEAARRAQEQRVRARMQGPLMP